MTNELAVPFAVRSTTSTPPIERLTPEASIVGASAALQHVMDQIEQVAPTNATVLLLGETGTGKGLLARSIHQRSLRRQRSFAVVDCGALPASLIESELFGRERGAFTGAHNAQPGRFEAASGGTVFLDEIGELPLELQPKLLRVLQDGRVDRLGAVHSSQVNVRIIAATNQHLTDAVRHGRFRRDLFYRLNVFPITVPALRDRREDLPALVRHLADRLGRELGRPIVRIAPGSVQALERHDWPGNIRELENVLQQAIVMSRGGVLDLSGFVGDPMNDINDGPRAAGHGLQSLDDAIRDHLRSALEHTSWRIEGASGAAALLGLKPSTLRSKMHKLGVQAAPKTPAVLPAHYEPVAADWRPPVTWARAARLIES